VANHYAFGWASTLHVRFVIHAAMPKDDVEHYQPGKGPREGDGLTARDVLL